jgi:hypothetical protein
VKGSIRLGGAVALGIAVIAVAFMMRAAHTDDQTGELVVAESATRPYIEAKDSNNDGIMDWEEQLGRRVIGSVDDLGAESTSTAVYTEPTTLTDKFARSFFEDYIRAKDTTAFQESQEAFLLTSIDAIEDDTQMALYTRHDINATVDSESAIREYGNRVSEIVTVHSVKNDNEANILARALDQNDPEILKQLEPTRDAYEKVLRDTLLVPTPHSLVDEQLDLVNTYQAILTDIIAMERAFTDPLYTLARMKRYEDDALGLLYAYINILKATDEAGIIYANDEPGVFLYFFES